MIELNREGIATRNGGAESFQHTEIDPKTGKRFLIKNLCVDEHGFANQREENADTRLLTSTEGFNYGIKEELERHYTKLVACYGEYIVKQRIKRKISRKDRFEIEQEFLKLAKPADIFEYDTGMLSEKTLGQLEDLLKKLKGVYAYFQGLMTSFQVPIMDPKINGYSRSMLVPLDLRGSGNLCVTKNGDIRYIDTGLKISSFDEPFFKYNQHEFFRQVAARIAALECVLGRKPPEFLDEPVYRKLATYCREDGISELWTKLQTQSSEECKRLLMDLEKHTKKKETSFKHFEEMWLN